MVKTKREKSSTKAFIVKLFFIINIVMIGLALLCSFLPLQIYRNGNPSSGLLFYLLKGIGEIVYYLRDWDMNYWLARSGEFSYEWFWVQRLGDLAIEFSLITIIIAGIINLCKKSFSKYWMVAAVCCFVINVIVSIIIENYCPRGEFGYTGYGYSVYTVGVGYILMAAICTAIFILSIVKERLVKSEAVIKDETV